jgi:hypothetical protein
LIVLIADVHLLCPHAAAACAASLRTGRRTVADGLAPYGKFLATSFASVMSTIVGPFVQPRQMPPTRSDHQLNKVGSLIS